MSYLSNFQIDENELKFDIHNLNCSLVNAIRRIIISDVPTLGFRTENGKESDIIIEKNTSFIHNEFLAHRLSLLPIHYDYKKLDSFEKKKYEFFIDVTNNTTKPLDVTTEHIQIRDMTKEPPIILSKSETQKFFKPNPISGQYILINRLQSSKSGTSGDGEVLKVKMYADVSTGKEHARYSPSCVSVFNNKRDLEKIKVALEQKIKEKNEQLEKDKKSHLTDPEKSALIKSFMVCDADFHYHTDEKGEPNVFEFTLESDGRIPSHIILDKAIFVLEKKLVDFLKRMELGETIIFKKSDVIMYSYDMIIDDEDYTLGYLLQHYLYKLYKDVEVGDRKINYVASNVPHPLVNQLVLRVGLVDNNLKEDFIKKLVISAVDEIKKVLGKLKDELKNCDKFVLER